MLDPRQLRSAILLTTAVLGSAVIAVSTFFVLGVAYHKPPDLIRVVASTVTITLAMIWACAFAARAQFDEDEFQRHREISVSFWGGWLGIAASAPVFFFVSVGGLRWVAPGVLPNIAMLRAFMLGYAVPIVCAVIGVVVAWWWRRLRDGNTSP
jgi:hypothetical protein